MNTARVEEHLKSAEHYHELYLKSLRLVYEAQAANARLARVGSNDVTASPLLRAATSGPARSISEPSRRSTTESPPLKPASVFDGFVLSAEESCDFLPLTPSPLRVAEAKIPESSTPFSSTVSTILKPLPQLSFSEDDLVGHIRSIDESRQGTITALGEVWPKRNELDASNILASFDTGEGSRYESATYAVYEVGRDATPKPMQTPSHQGHQAGGDGDGDNHDPSVWRVLKDINSAGSAVGRMTILQEPSSLILAATHLTMQRTFDMDELFQHLVSTDGNKGKTTAYMSRAFEASPLRQRSFFFVFKYYTIVGEGLTPAAWQAFDDRPADRRSPDHIDITECSSVLALSLGGDPTGTVKAKSKRRTRTGVLYDTFGPWQLLSIQCFPDDEHSMRSEEGRKQLWNGPYAFLDALCVEYRDAAKRYTQVNEMITKLITPPNQFMFSPRLRDKLLFEDSHFTYSRRYFWAYNTLGVINEGINSMRAAYAGAFTKAFWAGRHTTLWPHPNPDSPEGVEYAARMDVLRQELEAAVDELRVTHDKNEVTRTEIRSLREQLFSGSSVKESRRGVEQGDNIKILTSVSMVFLPLTFVVGVFGITSLTIPPTDFRFPLTLTAVCVPFFLLIAILHQPRAATELFRRLWTLFITWLRRLVRGVVGVFDRSGLIPPGTVSGSGERRGVGGDDEGG
ncbi:hypothetical protein C8A05DRAFT_38823 [Staphylotrichum tortipilum]|uniref:Uncharacterized protein n=1 Tax=Staphylotrichum tortipilum TaxID=2831512 RepID=A0AAN6RPF6_9PEZI|nr:hypothetical protein C8A05DRAFT_38823 [Staphylotrichum longicolle]